MELVDMFIFIDIVGAKTVMSWDQLLYAPLPVAKPWMRSLRPTNQIVENVGTKEYNLTSEKNTFSRDAHYARDTRASSVILWTRLIL